ncbi:NADH-quinone oxidoreductase subunit N [Granulicella mallensis]|jgi:NADH-quinone oxidoreductase subunit N|uniref:NADH-quinone oxidoreductase subunit N n=1 Tax=Granulicella mallensis TaxID=940614 RepID=A0A7W7ZT99_9BACT|nr:NADH-quinone oxidoreductase subunit N [Granulicella mallensis]MBB5065754.1 NADH-quinone oxidoreductase subunit N [Granulicella mallensis]
MPTNLLTLLPEIILTVTGVLVMLAEPMIAPGKSRKPLGWLAILGTLASGLAAFYQLQLVNASGPISGFYATIQVDAFSVFFHLLISSIVLVTLLASLDYFEGPVSHAGEYFALACFGATGMMFMTCSVELLMVFIGLEISSISTYILAGFRKGQATASESSLKYFLLGSFATAFFLYGIALCFGATGSTSIGAIAASLGTTATPALALLAIAMVVIGLGFKVSAAPFHVWTPDVYQGAPAPVVGMMSTAPKAAAFAVLLRFLFNAAPMYRNHWIVLIEILAVLSMTIGNLGALMQRDVKRLLAYSSIAHAGYLLVAFTSIQQDAVAAACFYTAAYAAMNVGAFLVITQLSGYDEQARTIDDFTGMALKRPGLSALLGFFLLSLIGIPFTGGFFGKFYAFSGAIHNGHVVLAIIGLANSGVACFYYLRLLAALYARPVREDATLLSPRKLAIPAGIAIAASAVATLALGIMPNHVLNLVQRATPETLPAFSVAPAVSTLPPAAPTEMTR